MESKSITTFAAPLALLAFWCGMLAAAHAYPGGYDWPYQTISVLLYRDHNPRGFLWGWLGLWLCGLAGHFWTAQGRGLRLLQAGFLFMCCAVLPDQLLPWDKGHELFAILAFLGIALGVTRQLARGRAATAAHATFRRIVPALPLVPLLLAGATQAWLALERPDLPWVTPAWRTRGISSLLSFGLWEWVSCAVFSLCLLLLWKRQLVVADADG